jgi:hypothetical protein
MIEVESFLVIWSDFFSLLFRSSFLVVYEKANRTYVPYPNRSKPFSHVCTMIQRW